jgi:hypothetical protein
MKPIEPFDFWYAVNNTEILVAPKWILETFGVTVVNYHLVTELMDQVNVVRVREGRLQAARPELITPDEYVESILEGFHEPEAEEYAQWLRQHQRDLLILRYGFRIRKEDVREEIIHDSIDAVIDRIAQELRHSDRPFESLVRGVDEPWEVCLVKLMVDLVQRAGPHHARALRADPTGARHRIEVAFRAAAKDRGRMAELADLLHRERLFEEYQDRFFSLVRAHARKG